MLSFLFLLAFFDFVNLYGNIIDTMLIITFKLAFMIIKCRKEDMQSTVLIHLVIYYHIVIYCRVCIENYIYTKHRIQDLFTNILMR